MPFALEMVPGSGQLLVRDAEESYPLASPTTYTGMIDGGGEGTGAITGASLTTPDIAFQVPVLNGQFMADVEARFTEVARGTATGSVSPDGGVVLTTSLRVDLHIEVRQAGVIADCTTTPVDLQLLSTAPYDAETQRVTVRDPNFTIPSFTSTDDCPSLVTGNLNPLLGGAGHSLELTLVGVIDLPPQPGCPSTTTLTASPAGGSRSGDEATFRAEVAIEDPADPLCTEVSPGAMPTGTVDFAVDGVPVETVVLVGGVAEMTTSDLTAGPHKVTAVYGGDAAYFRSSDRISYDIDAVPSVDADLPVVVVVGEDPEPFTVTVENPSLGAPIENVAVDITLTRPVGQFFFPGMVVLERRVSGDTWEEVPLTSAPDSVVILTGRIGPITGRALPARGSLVDDLRIRANPTGSDQVLKLGPVAVTLDVKELDPGTGADVATLGSSTGSILIADADRKPASIVIDEENYGPALSPTFVRAGNSITFNSWQLDTGGVPATGTVSVLLDGQPISLWHSQLTVDAERVMSAPIPITDIVVDTPTRLTTGVHTLTLVYSGDDILAPTSESRTFTVVNPRDPAYDCILDTLPGFRFRAQVRATARVPASAPAGSTFPLRNLDVEFVTDRNIRFGFFLIPDFIHTTPTVVGERLDSIAFDFGSEAVTAPSPATADSATRTGEFQFDPNDSDPDMRFTFDGERGSVAIAGKPGDVVPIDLNRLEVVGRGSFGSQFTISCAPVAEAARLATVTVAGTTLTVDGPQPTRADALVRLRATVAPATATGQVEFRAGEEVISVAPVRAGQAVANVFLPEGTHELTARFRAGASAPSTASAPVSVTVGPVFECSSFAEEGNGAVVRLVYMELLERCPDQVGFDYWTGRLDGGTSPEVFARSISRTPEAVGLVVDDAYRTTLGRAPEPAGRAFWVDRMRTGSGRYDHLLAELASSPEFWSLSGSTRIGLVTRVYGRLLGRAPEPAGLEYWTDRLATGTPHRALVLSLANTPEPLGRLVADAYEEILGRAPFTAEGSNGTSFLRSTGDRSGLYARLIGTTEFFGRAQGFPNPED